MVKLGWVRLIILFAIVLSNTPSVSAGNAIIIITGGGDGYNGPPVFNFLADGRVIGTRKVTRAIDTQAGSMFLASRVKLEDKVERFVFTVPEIENVATLELDFVNDASADEGKIGDRNLFITTISLNIVETTATGSIIRRVDFGPTSLRPSKNDQSGVKITKEWAALYLDGGLSLDRPVGGWSNIVGDTASKPKPQVTTSKSPNQTKVRKPAVASEPPKKKPPQEPIEKAVTSTALESPEKERATTKNTNAKRPEETVAIPDEAVASTAGTPDAEAAEGAPVEPKARNFSRYLITERKNKCKRTFSRASDLDC